ncbi:hypothetical protein FRC04_000276 [Tulasnella sp. 424]|nr:hypothetical protein FRC04_000276 [Tulasnella sp. 424]
MATTASGFPPKDASDDQFQLTHHRLLGIPEILIDVFSNCSPSTNAALTRVCRTWSDLASDQLWSSLPSLLPLLRILLPLVLVDDALDFDLTARAPNWERFWALASRVRKLEHDDGPSGGTTELPTEPSGRISPNVIPFLLLRQSWTSKQFLLPNLQTLKWSIWWEDSFLQLSHFLSPTLRNLILYIEEPVPVDHATRNLERLALLPSMNLERLNIGTHYRIEDLDEQVALVVASFVKSQPTLSILDLSKLWSRGEVVRGFVQHEGLQCLELNLCPALLLDFAEEFSPRLRRLALHFLCDGELPTPDVVRVPFPKLEVLGVGAATAASTARAIAIGEFLASVVSEGTRLAYMPDNWVGNDAFDTTNWKRSSRAGHWVEVAAILGSAQRLQKVASEKALRAKEFQRF